MIMSSIIISLDDNTDINIIYNQIRKLYPKFEITKNSKSLDEMLEDEYLLALVEERKKNDTGVRYSFEEILAKDGLTIEDIDRMLEEEDIEIE